MTPPANIRRFALALLLLASSCLGDTLRVSSWNLQTLTALPRGDTNRALSEAAAALKQLDPDVILLQGARDWPMCAQLVRALAPLQYRVLVCSAFQDELPADPHPSQVAILAKAAAYFTWSEAWQPVLKTNSAGGFAFAAIQKNNQRLGFLSAQFDGRAPPDTAIAQLLAQISSVRHWEANQVHTFILGSSLDLHSRDLSSAADRVVHLLQNAGFENPLTELPAAQSTVSTPTLELSRTPADALFVDEQAYPRNPQRISASISDHDLVTCEVELDPIKVAAFRAVAEKAARIPATPPAKVAVPPGFLEALPWWLPPALGAVLALLALLLLLARRRPLRPAAPPLIPEHAASSSYTVVLTPDFAPGLGSPTGADTAPSPPVLHIDAPGATQTQSADWRQRALGAEQRADQMGAVLRQGLIPHLARWLKHKLVRQLTTDRSSLLAAQAAASRQATAVDERLARIELQIRRQNRAYERRIEELTAELQAAKTENRQLIRARIEQIKAEMQAVRARLLAQAQADDQRSEPG